MENESISKTLSTPIAIVIAGMFIAGALFFGNRGVSAPIVAGAQQPTQQAPAPQVAVDISKVKTAGEPFIGSPNAPVTMAYWYDYQCPFCKRNEEEVMPQIVKNYVDTGKLKIVFKDFQFLGEDSQRLGQFSRAVWAVAADKFYQWHKAIYDNQGTENTGWATVDKITAISKGVLGTDLTNKALQNVKDNGATYQKEMDADKTEGGAMGINGTPGTIIGKQLVSGAQPYDAFKAAIESALQGK